MTVKFDDRFTVKDILLCLFNFCYSFPSVKMGSSPYFTTQTINQENFELTISSYEPIGLNLIDNGDYVQAGFGGALVGRLHC